MDRHYVPLRPWSPGAEDVSPATPHSPESKRRRVGVAIACNDCRRRKIRCDGQRPKCSNCQGKSNPCEYRDDGDLSKESKELVLEVTRTLAQLPDAGKIRVLQELRDESNAWTILSTLRHKGTDSREDASGDSSGPMSATDDGTCDGTQLWESQNPVAYPDKQATEPNVMPNELTPFPTQHDFSPGQMQTQNDRSMTAESRGANAESVNAEPWAGLAAERERERRDGSQLCDARLARLNIRYWTKIDISDDLAARCISLYLKTDHPLLGHFDPELFVSHLISKEHEYCSSLLVHSMLYWACQMYSAIDPQTDSLATEFCAEAEALWTAEREQGHDSTLTLAAAEFLSLGYLGQGRDHAVLRYLAEAAHMAGRMGLFNSQGQTDDQQTQSFAGLTGAAKAAHMYAAWGIFNWLTLMSLFYHQPGMICPTSPPLIAVPKGPLLDTSKKSLVLDAEVVSWLPAYMGDTFPYLCWFWTIVREVTWEYYVGGETTSSSRGSLAFAEFKFRELLAWTNSLPRQLSSNYDSQHHVQVMHIWFHACVLDLFRPFMGRGSDKDHRLRTFASNTCTTSAIYETSTTQLKRLMINFQLNYTSSNFTILWHTALIYVANAMLEANPKEEDWHTYLLFCLHGYERLSRSWRVAKSISKALLSLTLRKGGISSEKARQMLQDLEGNHVEQMPGEIRATFMMDLERAVSEPNTATVEYLANQFEDNLIIEKYTNMFDGDLH
ncbi:hypothetical protein E4U41_007141 [Claviceps citrina]|nr:hypothetical protein E4U41_007141 [Claviceps citrina]